MPVPQSGHFFGPTYNPKYDYDRLNANLKKLYFLMTDAKWRTLQEINYTTGIPEASASAGLRSLQHVKFGGHRLEHQYRGPPKDGLYEYQITWDPDFVPIKTIPRRVLQKQKDDLYEAIDYLLDVKEHKDKYGKLTPWYKEHQPKAWLQAQEARMECK